MKVRKEVLMQLSATINNKFYIYVNYLLIQIN